MTERTNTSSQEGSHPVFSLRRAGHDLRNALNVIRNANYMLRRKLMASGGEFAELVEMIEDSVKSAEAIATQMMNESSRLGEPPLSRGGPAD